MKPFFSIIIPVYNRAAVVGRAIRSSLSQSFESFEIVVADDGSRDKSVDIASSFSDPRLRIVVHEKNCGRGPARNTGMRAAQGEWFVFLDSDDELLPGALEAIHSRAVAADPEVGALRFMCVDQSGTSPQPPHRDQILNYEGYLRSLDETVKHETLPCARATTFPAVQYTDSHASEQWYHLELARTTLIQACSDVVRYYHHDAIDRVTVPVASRTLLHAADDADDARQVLAVHGESMRRFAPETFLMTLTSAVTSSLIAGRRLDGLRYALRAWRVEPLSMRLYVVVFLGMLNRRLLAEVQAFRARLLSRKTRSLRREFD